jgi:hypothetical protein
MTRTRLADILDATGTWTLRLALLVFVFTAGMYVADGLTGTALLAWTLPIGIVGVAAGLAADAVRPTTPEQPEQEEPS